MRTAGAEVRYLARRAAASDRVLDAMLILDLSDRATLALSALFELAREMPAVAQRVLDQAEAKHPVLSKQIATGLSDRAAGWARIGAGRKWHYFPADARLSACGLYARFLSAEVEPDDGTVGAGDCARCASRR